MFVYSVRSSTIKFFAIIALAVIVLSAALIIGGTRSEAYLASGNTSVDFSGVKTNDDRLRFIRQFVPEVAGEAKESVTFSVPADFDRVLRSYNEIQKSQGLDITKYKNKKVTRYTYELEKYGDYDKPVYINLIVYRSNVIACDISSADPDGFIKPLVSLS